MQKYQFTCTCGEVMTTEAGSRDEAVEKFKGMMNEDAIKAHMADKHPGDPVPSVEEAHVNIENSVIEAKEGGEEEATS